ncbi:IS110 family transposase [Bacteroidia bacterium]|nr:IS110 family transposase [Bacteroidia bacterium]
MAKVQIYYAGIDTSKETFDVAFEKNGRETSRKFAYTPQGMASLLDRVHCVVESTGTCHCRLACFLYARRVRLSVVNPLPVKRYGQALVLRAKTGKADSCMLKGHGEQMQPQSREPKEDKHVEMQQLVQLPGQFCKQERVLKNQREAFARPVVQNEFVKARLQASIAGLEAAVKEVEKEMETFVQAREKEVFERLTAIPGIGKKTAIVPVALTRGMKGFDSAKQLASCFGLCPRIIHSGTSVRGKVGICKMGMGLMRKLLYLCALPAKRCNKVCRELHERLLEQGRPKKPALIAVANKLPRQAFAIARNNRLCLDDFDRTKNLTS